jgi:hypothetical protein
MFEEGGVGPAGGCEAAEDRRFESLAELGPALEGRDEDGQQRERGLEFRFELPPTRWTRYPTEVGMAQR